MRYFLRRTHGFLNSLDFFQEFRVSIAFAYCKFLLAGYVRPSCYDPSSPLYNLNLNKKLFFVAIHVSQLLMFALIKPYREINISMF